jgi:cytochrome oxidase Cu insertion factor (SCO1/SenC/PrrC family)
VTDDPLRTWRPPRYTVFAVAAAVGVIVGLGAAVLRASHAPAARPGLLRAQATWATGVKTAPAFSLPDQRGRRISLRSLRGHAVLVTFLDSRCKRECPLEGRVLGDVMHAVARQGAVLLIVSVDPWADTPASARAFATRARWRGDWHWLLADRAGLVPVWRAFNIGVKRVPGDVMHSVALYLVDREGDLRAAYLFPFSAEAVASDVRRLTG